MKYQVDGQLLKVVFPEFPFFGDAEDAHILHTFFPGRAAYFTPDGKWVGVTCLPEEWLFYLTLMERTYSAAPGAEGILRVILLLKEKYYQFMTINGTFKLARGCQD